MGRALSGHGHGWGDRAMAERDIGVPGEREEAGGSRGRSRPEPRRGAELGRGAEALAAQPRPRCRSLPWGRSLLVLSWPRHHSRHQTLPADGF